jgi:hypothetical protein
MCVCGGACAVCRVPCAVCRVPCAVCRVRVVLTISARHDDACRANKSILSSRADYFNIMFMSQWRESDLVPATHAGRGGCWLQLAHQFADGCI